MKLWIKLYTEALHDRKMRKMNRVTKSVFYDLCLLAGQEDNDGALPDLEDIALELDMKVTEAKKYVTELIKIGVLSEDDNGNLIVTKFKARQDTNLTNAEKQQRYREKQQSGNGKVTQVTETLPESNPKVTEQLPDCMKKVTVEIELEKEKELNINSLSGDRELDAPAKKAPKAAPKPKPEKHKHGSFGNVLLTDEELEKLHERFIDAEGRIEAFSKKKAAKGYVYKSDYAAILSWADSDAKKDAEKAQTKPEKKRTFADIAADFENQADGEPHPEWGIIDL